MTDDEDDLFRRTVGKVRPLKNDKIEPTTDRPRPLARFRRLDEETVLEESISGDIDHADIETGDELQFRRDGTSQVLFRRLRRGRMSIEGELDLHGLNSVEAHEALAEFLLEARSHGLRCVRVIHGKGLRSGPGGPVIKKQIGRWLRRRDEVVAFCSSRPVDGGTGALYVLLKS